MTSSNDQIPLSLILYGLEQERLDAAIREGFTAAVIQYYNYYEDETGVPDTTFMEALDTLNWVSGLGDDAPMEVVREVQQALTHEGRTFDPLPEDEA